MAKIIVPILMVLLMAWLVVSMPMAQHDWETKCQKYEALICSFYPFGCSCVENPVLKDIYQRLP